MVYSYVVYSSIIKISQDYKNTDEWLYVLLCVYMSDPFRCGCTLNGTSFCSSSDYSEQDLNKLVSPSTYVNKFANTFKHLQINNKKWPFMKSDLHNILYFVCIFLENVLCSETWMYATWLSKFKQFSPLLNMSVINSWSKFTTFTLHHDILSKIQELRNKYCIWKAAIKLL